MTHFRVLVISTSTMPDSKLAALLDPFKQDPDYEQLGGKWDAWNRIEIDDLATADKSSLHNECYATLFCGNWVEREGVEAADWEVHVNKVLNHRRAGSWAIVDCHI